MQAVQLFLTINKPGLNNDWNKQINTALQSLSTVERIEIIEQNESSDAQIQLTYNPTKLSFQEIEKTLTNTGATLTEINIHFPTDVSGTADPYGASVVATKGEDDLNSIKGVLGIGVSSAGIIKASLDPATENKQTAIDNIISHTSRFRHQ